jgi:hypothetical protein
MNAKVSVRDVHQALEIIKSQRIISGERADYTKAQSLVDQAVKQRRGILCFSAAKLPRSWRGIVSSLRGMF